MSIDIYRHAAMRHTADALIGDALRGRTPQWPRIPHHEPSAVQAVTLGGVSQIAQAWNFLLRPSGLVVTTHAVFCHSSPQVDFASSGSSKPPVELADLLVVVDVLGSTGPSRRARLIQAKVAAGNGDINLSPGKEQVQLDLLSRWPNFRFIAKAYSSTLWDLSDPLCPGNARQSGRYGGIDRDLTSWRQIPPSAAMSMAGAPSLGSEIAGMALGFSGRQARLTGGDPWSDLICELMRVTYATVYGRARPHVRGHSSSSQFLTSSYGAQATGATSLAWESIPDHPGPDTTTEIPEGPISIVHLTVSQPEQAPELPAERAD